MKKGWIVAIVIVVILIVIIAGLGGSYNKMVSMQEEVDSKWANIDTQLQRRMDLIPNLVNTVKGFASHEQEIINSVTDARSKLSGANSVEEKANANNELSGALSRLLVVVENYPDLKANQNFQALSDELAGTENRIAVARKDYNDVVKEYNQKIKKFPSNMIAGMFGFETKQYFEAKEGADNAPVVEF